MSSDGDTLFCMNDKMLQEGKNGISLLEGPIRGKNIIQCGFTVQAKVYRS